ncbi:protein tyrosine kinase domain-containing protein [Phthorimaea operculella]|nr:protein tyrosine kinase domain-containing protein [Phthorimaea operculella]
MRGCRVIEGQLSIVLMERVQTKDFANLTFPELREVTGYVKLYRMKGMRNLGDLFPNLQVIRGMQLFKDFALVIFDCSDFEMLGLRSLTTIERGAVRIQNNDRLCYADTIDWGRIILEGNSNNMIRANYDTRLCGLCPDAQGRLQDHRQTRQCPADSQGRLLCWDDKHCQKVCPSACGGRACMADGQCCHSECLGGCDGPSVRQCHVCRHFSIGYGENRTCVRTCPTNSYELYRRCVSEVECRKTPGPLVVGKVETSSPSINAYKIFNNSKCVWACPSGYMEHGDEKNATCEKCTPPGCAKDCVGGKIDSIASTEKYRGCTTINGDLEISIRATGSNTMAALEAGLGDVITINGALKVIRSNPLVSLMFLKNLQHINAGENNEALRIFGNDNLEMLWEWKNMKKKLQIIGTLHVHYNNKLCYQLIEELKDYMPSYKNRNFSENDVSAANNGQQAPCFKEHLNLSVSELRQKFVALKCSPYCTDDTRKLLGYSVYYMPAEQNVTLYGQRDACSDSWNVVDITVDEARGSNSSKSDYSVPTIDFYTQPCKDAQPLFFPLNQLTPFTRYAAYVKTYTTLQDQKGAQSDIIYFKTLPDKPSPPQSLSVEVLDHNSVYIKWLPPVAPNGTIILYHVQIHANVYNKDTIVSGNINYCTSPNQMASLLAIRSPDDVDPKPETIANIADKNNATCACKPDNKPVTKFDTKAEEERRESILFENELQNAVYVKANKTKVNLKKWNITNRSRRSVETSSASLLSTLVILSGNTRPTIGGVYVNTTEAANCSHAEPNLCIIYDNGTGYVKSQYLNLGGNVLSATVKNLRHFTWYTVNVWACRERQGNETDAAYAELWCSDRAYKNFRTLEKPNADIVTEVHTVVLSSNKTLPVVNVTWAPPVNPNGFVVAYNVHYSRVEDNNQAQGPQNCITASECKNNTCTTLLRNMLPGNYSVKVTPVTVSGLGNGSAQAYVVIQEPAAGHEWIWGLIGGCIVLILVVGVGLWYAKREFLQPNEANKLFASVNPEYVSTVYVPDEWEVPRANIEFIRELGQGSFGMVYEGIGKNIIKGKPETRCAVKTVNEHATDRERIEFLNEASVMKAFDTFHVVRLLGVVSRGQPTLVVMELMEFGDLKTYLRSHRPDSDNSLPKKDGNNQPPTLANILQMAIEIADGMAYLSAKKFVHRDLAARNCMVAGDLTVKVGDFGMTRDIYETDYYRKGTKGLLPVRWMSPESLKDGVSTLQTL